MGSFGKIMTREGGHIALFASVLFSALAIWLAKFDSGFSYKRAFIDAASNVRFWGQSGSVLRCAKESANSHKRTFLELACRIQLS